MAGQELVFIEEASGDWFYIIEDRHAPKDAWDWMEFATCHGPFASLQAAEQHEYESPSDTSGAEIIPYGSSSVRGTARQLIDERKAHPTFA